MEIENAVNQANKELANRFDFKGSNAQIVLEKTEIKGPVTHEYRDHYLGWLLLAMVLLSVGEGLQMTVWRTVP